MKKKSRWIVAVGLALALVLSLAPTQALAADVPVTPNGPYSVPAGGTCTITVDIGDVDDLAIAQFEVGYDAAVLSYTGYTLGDFWSGYEGAMEVAVSVLTSPDRIRCYLEYKEAACIPPPPPPPTPVGIDGSGDLIHLEFDVIGVGCDACDIEMSPFAFNGLFDACAVDVDASWADTTLEVTPCEPFEPVVVSGKSDGTGPPTLPYGDWAVLGNDWGWDPEVGPPGFVESDQFKYCEWVWVWGSGFTECQTYKIWIQAYDKDNSVVEGQVLLATEPPCPPQFPLPSPPLPPEKQPDPLPAGWCPGWVEVHIGVGGTFGPVPVWHVPEGLYCTTWEIVADKQGPGYGDPDTYNAEWDGLDAIATDVGGFHIYPEGLTIILVALGLVAVGGYLVVRRRRGVETDLDL